MVEGVTEYLLLHAIGKALGWPLDDHGVAVIDFTQSGSAGVYPALAEAFKIPWNMITDGDAESVKFRQHIIDRGFTDTEIDSHFRTLTSPNDLEDQLLADGHEQILREILGKVSGPVAVALPIDDFRVRLKKLKTGYMSVLATRVATDPALAARMPEPFVTVITSLRDA
jgi:putative ATP-dependent endonuclease of OLD family